ncbi:hypothetical protein DFJ74DRAFT_684005 [Hyaloraphidium curvatum]|nr:hypothetical protein DFJ74DRAFT_684005 [Hyaloraphidium curvatum]
MPCCFSYETMHSRIAVGRCPRPTCHLSTLPIQDSKNPGKRLTFSLSSLGMMIVHEHVRVEIRRTHCLPTYNVARFQLPNSRRFLPGDGLPSILVRLCLALRPKLLPPYPLVPPHPCQRTPQCDPQPRRHVLRHHRRHVGPLVPGHPPRQPPCQPRREPRRGDADHQDGQLRRAELVLLVVLCAGGRPRGPDVVQRDGAQSQTGEESVHAVGAVEAEPHACNGGGGQGAEQRGAEEGVEARVPPAEGADELQREEQPWEREHGVREVRGDVVAVIFKEAAHGVDRLFAVFLEELHKRLRERDRHVLHARSVQLGRKRPQDVAKHVRSHHEPVRKAGAGKGRAGPERRQDARHHGIRSPQSSRRRRW